MIDDLSVSVMVMLLTEELLQSDHITLMINDIANRTKGHT